MSCDVLLLAAGFGTRLRPLTDHTPKPLVTVGGVTLIERNLRLLASRGFERVIINLHHLGDQIQGFVGDGHQFGLGVEYSHEPVLLDTGGAVRKIESVLRTDSLLVINSDIIVSASMPLERVVSAHVSHPAAPVATLVLRPDEQAERYGALGVDGTGRIVRFLDAKAPDAPPDHETLMFTGISVLSRSLIFRMPESGEIFSLTRDVYRIAVQEGKILQAFRHDGYWNDVGTPERLTQASKDLEAGRVS